MLRVGVTGGIAAGKSTVTGWLGELGALVVDADRIAREVVEPGTEGLAAVVAQFGTGVLAPDGEHLDRGALARIVFSDPEARRRLEAITHPLIARRAGGIMDAADPGRIIVHDVPLIVEKHLGAQYHLVVVVHAEAAERVARLVRLRGLSEAEAWSRVESQSGDDARRAAADVVLDTSEGLEVLRERVAELWHDRLVPYDENLRQAVRAPRGRAAILPYQPSWQDDARRLIERIRRAVGEPLEVEHIGSTAVPGLVAKDVIDLQIAVPAPADADRIRPDLDRAGFARVEGLTWDNPHPAVDPDPEHWQKRFHASCDPGRPANVHLRVQGGPGWRTALLMRDWFRASAAVRAEYSAVKEALAAAGASEAEYAMAKEPWNLAAVARAVAWDRSGRPEEGPERRE